MVHESETRIHVSNFPYNLKQTASRLSLEHNKVPNYQDTNQFLTPMQNN